MEKKLYRIGYDQVFAADPAIQVEDKTITSLTLWLKYKLFDIKTGLEILFTGEEQSIGKKGGWVVSEPILHLKLADAYISNFVECSFSEESENYIKVTIFEEELKKMGYRLEYEIADCSKDTEEIPGIAEGIEISEEEFFKILKENYKNFDNYENNSTQTSAYCRFPVLEEIKNEN